jgi:hypothetical protein
MSKRNRKKPTEWRLIAVLGVAFALIAAVMIYGG